LWTPCGRALLHRWGSARRIGEHDYYLTATALDVPKSGVDATASPALLGFTIGSHTIARATLVCPTVG
jgi:phosphatidylethanolamine-binding protein (PEBP) family uncharacterized protein